MPLALLALTISAFAIGTTEFVIVGLVPTIAQQLGVSVPSAGLLVSIYALGVAIGAPVLTALTSRVPRKTLLIGLMVLFTLGNLLAWQSPNYSTLVMARLLTGLAHGVFFSIGSTIATSLVSKEKAASAIALMFGGLTVALVTGVPLGTFIGQHFGWRETFLAVSLIGVVAIIAFGNVPGLQVYVVQKAEEVTPNAVDVASGLNIAAFNVGIALGSVIGGQVVSTIGLAQTPWIGAVIVAGALLLIRLSGHLDRKPKAALA